MHIRLKKLLLLLGDVVLLYISLLLVLYFFYGESIDQATVWEHIQAFTILFVLWEAVFYIWNLYNFELESYVNNYVKAIVMNVIIAIMFFYIVPFFRIAPKTNLLLTVFFFTLFFVLWRVAAIYLFSLIRPYYQLVLVGMDTHMKDLAWRVINKRGSNYSLHAVIDIEGDEIPHFVLDQKIKVEKDLEFLKRLSAHKQPVKVVVSDSLYPNLLKKLYNYLNDSISFYFVASFWEEAEQEIPIYATNELWFLDNLRNVHKREYEVVKRASDLLFGLLFLPIVFVVYLCAGLAIKINSPGPIIFKQKRVGRNGEHFTLLKFRTMRQDAEQDGKPRWATEKDSRITTVGNILRRSRIDELPQILNVLRGEMSFIGPRPERPEFVQILSERIPHYELRHLVRPGLTGWAQVHYEYASSEEETAIKLSYDLFYVKNRSLALDLKIILKTILVIIERKGR
jgi:exopolysaccharide biosynthesis polyprenyl glycosylphosphotransferase